MINPFNYLFYKIYVFLSHISGGGNPITHLAAMGTILLSNIITINMLITKKFPTDEFLKVVFVILSLLLFYAVPKISDKIISKYEKESEKSRLIGNTVVTFYVILSVVALILVNRMRK